MEKAWKSIFVARAISKESPDDSFVLSYEAMLKISLALMLARGYRPKVQLGHHKTLVSFAKYVLKNFIDLTNTYDKIRAKRNKIIYDIASVSTTESKAAIATAEKYFRVVEDRISKDNPQQKLWKP